MSIKKSDFLKFLNIFAAEYTIKEYHIIINKNTGDFLI